MNDRNVISGFFDLKWHSCLCLIMRLVLGTIFLAACIYKIKNPHEFALSVATYDILPTEMINLMAIALPWVELFAGLMLLIGFRSRSGVLLVSGMMIMFIVALSIALARGIDMSCGCFASAETGESIGPLTLVRDVVLLLMAVYVLFFDRKPLGMDRLPNRRN